jgi:hypothetical protein
MEYLSIMMNMKMNLENISYEKSSYYELAKIADLLLQDAKKLEEEKNRRESRKPVVMSLTLSEVVIALWRDGWIHHTFKGHNVAVCRCNTAEDISYWKLTGPSAEDGFTYFIRVRENYGHESGFWISKDEADVLHMQLIKAYGSVPYPYDGQNVIT